MKTRTTTAAITLAACAGAASASVFTPAADFVSADIAAPSGTWVLTIDISGFSTRDLLGDPDNEFFTILDQPKDGDQARGSLNAIIGIGWDVTLSTVGDSWASEATINFGAQLDLTPGINDAFPVANSSYNSGGIVDLVDAGVAPVSFDDQGAIRVEFYESFDDTANIPEATFADGSTLTIRTRFAATYVIPSAPTLAPLAVAGLAMARRKRQ